MDPDFIDEKQEEINMLVLKALTSPSRLCALTTLTAIVECASSMFCSGIRHEKAIRFALDTVLLARGHVDDESEKGGSDFEKLSGDDDEQNRMTSGDDSNLSISCNRRRSSVNGLGKSRNTMGDIPKMLSVPCRRACAAINFLVGQIRSTIVQSAHSKNKQGKKVKNVVAGNSSDQTKSVIKLPSSQHISSVFNVLINVIQDSGLPPSSRDRHECKGTRERAALRECAALNLLRLCDSRLKLESKYLSPKMWHVLGGCFLDEEKSVRGT